MGFGATANLPLRDRHGGSIGALGIAWDHPVTVRRRPPRPALHGRRHRRPDPRARAARRPPPGRRAAQRVAGRAGRGAGHGAVGRRGGRGGRRPRRASVVGAPAPTSPSSTRPPVGSACTARGRGRRGAGPHRGARGADAGPHVDVMRDGGTLTFADRASYVAAYPHLEAGLVEAGLRGGARASSCGTRVGQPARRRRASGGPTRSSSTKRSSPASAAWPTSAPRPSSGPSCPTPSTGSSPRSRPACSRRCPTRRRPVVRGPLPARRPQRGHGRRLVRGHGPGRRPVRRGARRRGRPRHHGRRADGAVPLGDRRAHPARHAARGPLLAGHLRGPAATPPSPPPSSWWWTSPPGGCATSPPVTPRRSCASPAARSCC